MIRLNQTFVDQWTVPHTLMGVAAGIVGMPFPVYFGLAVVYDLVEMQMEKTEFGQRLFGTQEHENLTNIAGDLVFGTAGYWGARLIDERSQR